MGTLRVLWTFVILLGLSGIAAAQGTNANLGSVAIFWGNDLTSGQVDLQFDPATTAYSATVPSSLNAVYIEWVAEDTAATVRLNGANVASEGGEELAVDVDDLPLDVRLEVSSSDGNTTRLYVFTLIAQVSSNPTIQTVEVVPGTASIGFDPTGVERMRVLVPKSQTSVSISATPVEPTTRFTVAGLPATAGVPVEGVPVPLFEPAVNEILIRATAEDGVTTREYTVEIVRARSSDASLASLTNADPTYPLVQESPTAWSLGLPQAVPAISIVPTAADADATIEVIVGAQTAVAAASGQPFGPIEVPVQGVDVVLRVTSQDGTSSRAYELSVRRLIDPALRLTAFETTGFCCSTTTLLDGPFEAIAPPTASSIDVKFVLADPTSTMTLGGEPLANDTFRSISVETPYPATAPLALPLRVRKADGSAEVERTLYIIREPSSDKSLSGLSVSGGELQPAFSPLRTGYDVRGELGEAVTFTPIASDPRARVLFASIALPSTIEIPRGQSTPPILLPSESLGVGFQVIAEDGTSEVYAAFLLGRSSNATLLSPGISGGRLFPSFDSTIQEYEFRLRSTETSVTVAPIPMQPSSTIRVNGQPVADGQVAGPIDVTGSPPPIEIEVTSQVGTIRTYRFSLTRNAPPEIDAPPSVALLEDSETVVPIDVRDPNDPAKDLLVFVQNTNLLLFDIIAADREARTGGAVRPLTVVPLPNQAGTAQYVLRVEDPVGEEQTILINATVTPVNDPPRFDIERTNLQAELGATRLTAMNVLRFVAPGPDSERGQRLTPLITSRPARGNLLVTGASYDIQNDILDLNLNGQPGTVLLDLAFRDDAGTANGGLDTSVTKTLLVNMPSSPQAVDLSVSISRTSGNDSSASYEVVATNYGPAVAQGVQVMIPKPEGIEVDSLQCLVSGGSDCVLSEEDGITVATLDLERTGFVRVVLNATSPPEANFVQINAEVRATPGTVVDNPFDDRAVYIKAVRGGVLRDGFEVR